MSAAQRITAYIDRRKQFRGIDFNHIHGLDMSPECGFELTVSDINALLQQRAELLEALKAAQKKGSRWHPADPVVQQINTAITRAEAAE